MIKRWPVGALFGIAAVAVYVVMGLISFSYYPDAYSPLHNAISELGVSSQNPSGHIFYNLGGILMGLLLIPFYLGMSRWNTGGGMLKILIIGAQASGIISSLGLVWSCIFPAGATLDLHILGVSIAFISSILFWIFTAFAIIRVPASIKWMAFFGWLPITCNIILAFISSGRFLTEWVSVGFFLVYVVLLSYNSRVIRQSAVS